MSSWNDSIHFCQWKDVSCGRRHQRVTVLNLQSQKLVVSISPNVGNLSFLGKLNLENNSFYNEIPPEIGRLHRLEVLLLNNNTIGGTIPSNLSSCAKLRVFHAAVNNLVGEIPTELGTLSKLRIFAIHKNVLTGIIPPSFGNLSSLEVNQIQGHLPSDIGITLPNLETFTISNNQFIGSIPISISSASNLHILNLAENKLTGKVPSLEKLNRVRLFSIAENQLGNGGANDLSFLCSLSNATNLRDLEINTNNFGGELPKCIGNISTNLTFFYLNNNKISGNIPSVIGNIIKMEDIEMWNNKFSVYKGILDQYKHNVAIKVLNLGCHGASKSFKAECEALRNIRHRNLVKVLTACSGVDYQGHDFKALEYEFMENGNLDEWLHPTPKKINETIKKQRKLSLLQRLNIAIDVASALDYLHHHCETPIVHCDLKPSNVLLDDEMIGHVSDFGLARILHDIVHNSYTNQSSSIGVKGTVGYTPPEYGVGNKVSIYGDVYSYGILLLEMFTGKKPIDNSFHDSLNLHDFVKANLPEQIFDIIDPILLPKRQEGGRRMNDTCNENRNGSLKIQECLILILGIGIACSTEYPRERMNISAVVVELHSIRQNLLRTCIRQGEPTKVKEALQDES
nr:probable LRR receptor-like serine/threonine-protein kinase At3g47570 [Quercus suber]